MRLLALESATGSVAAALADEEGVLCEVTVRSARRHVELLHPAVNEVLALADVELSSLDAVAADVGPGLFTGIRVGVSAAKAMAASLDLPVVGVTSLAILEHACLETGAAPGSVVPVVDLRRGEVAWQREGTVGFGPPAKLLEELGGAEGLVLAGGGALAHPELLARPSWRAAGELLAWPPVASLAVLAVAAFRAGQAVAPAQLQPCYLREADARINWTTRHDPPSRRGP